MTSVVAPIAPASLHRRRNPLNGRWVLVSPHRNERPWHGAIASEQLETVKSHDPDCHLCPGNSRASGAVNPTYTSVHVFDNDFPALRANPATGDDVQAMRTDELFTAEPAAGHCRVICYSPDHHRGLSRLCRAEIRQVIDCWADEIVELAGKHRWVQVFENKGEMMGCSNPHPHGQIWATDHLPEEIQLEDQHQREWLQRHGTPMLLQLAASEAGGSREVFCNEHWLVIVPWWAMWPFETLLLPRFPVQRLPMLTVAQRDSLAAALAELTRRYDALFACDFPYSMGWHGAPHDSDEVSHFQLHAHFFPPLLRSSTVRKFMVGYEMLAEAQRDLTAEQAARRLRETHVHPAP